MAQLTMVLLTLASPGPVLWQIGDFSLRWYGVLIGFAVLIGTLISQKLAAKQGINPDLIPDMTLWLVVGAIPMARLYYVAFEWHHRFQYLPLWHIFAVWEGGIAIHGAIIGGTIAGYLFCLQHRISFWQVGDIVMPSLILGQAIGRWGNFFNSEAFGTPTDLPWKLYIPPAQRPPEFMQASFFHPTFLYESLWNLMVFALLLLVWHKFPHRRAGTLVMLYLIGYSLGRFWIEGLRTDSLMFGGIRVAQLVSAVSIVAGMVGLWWLYIRKNNFPDILNNSQQKS